MKEQAMAFAKANNVPVEIVGEDLVENWVTPKEEIFSHTNRITNRKQYTVQLADPTGEWNMVENVNGLLAMYNPSAVQFRKIFHKFTFGADAEHVPYALTPQEVLQDAREPFLGGLWRDLGEGQDMVENRVGV